MQNASQQILQTVEKMQRHRREADSEIEWQNRLKKNDTMDLALDRKREKENLKKRQVAFGYIRAQIPHERNKRLAESINLLWTIYILFL